jgi:hypothetical protein
VALAPIAPAASVLDGHFQFGYGCSFLYGHGGITGTDDAGSSFSFVGFGTNDPLGCQMYDLLAGQTYTNTLPVDSTWYHLPNTFGMGGTARNFHAQSALIGGRLYTYPVFHGDILFKIPSITIPDTTTPLITLTDLPVEYLIVFDGWGTWWDYEWGDSPTFHFSASGIARISSLMLEGWEDHEGVWRYHFHTAGVNLSEPGIWTVLTADVSLPEPQTWTLLTAGLVTIIFGAAFRRRHRRS